MDRAYLHDIAPFTLLTAKQEQALARGIQHTRKRLIELVAKLPLIARQVGMSTGTPPEDAKRLRRALARLQKDDTWRKESRERELALKALSRALLRLEADHAIHSSWLLLARRTHQQARDLGDPGSGASIADFQRQHFLPLAEILRILDEFAEVDREYQRFVGRLVHANLRLAVSIAGRYRDTRLPAEDLVQEGNLGLIRAAEKFDPTLGYRFSTYAIRWVRQFIQRALDQSAVIRAPHNIVATRKRVRRAATRLRAQEGREPTMNELSRESGLEAKVITDVRDTITWAVSMEGPAYQDGPAWQELIPDDHGTPATHTVEQHEVADAIRRALGTLSPREERILRLRFGIGSTRPQTLQEIAEMMGVTRERIRQIEERALGKLRKDGTRRRLEPHT